jgi:hypothetical protein
MSVVVTLDSFLKKVSTLSKEIIMRYIRNKKTGRIEKQYPHLIHGQTMYLPINDHWEYISAEEAEKNR